MRDSRSILDEYSGGDFTLGQVELLEKGFRGVYSSLQNLMNESESEVCTSLHRNTTLLVQVAEQMRDLQKSTTWESLDHNYQEVVPVVLRSLKNRASVTSDEEDKRTLEQAVQELDEELPNLRKTCQDARNDPTGKTQESTRSCNNTIRIAHRVLDVLSRHIIGDAAFKHNGIEPEAFNDDLDALLNAINRGDASGVRGAASDLADRTRDLQKRQALEDASAALKDQTKELLAASAEALKNKDSDDAKGRLASLVSSMKANVADMAAQEEAANRRKQMLLRAAGGLGQAVDGLANSANAFREGHSAPQGPSESAMASEERNRVELDKQRGVQNPNVELSGQGSAQHTATATAAAPSADAELDDLLSGLDNL